MGTNPKWWAKGLLFENCNCQVVCPGHVHFEQLCTFERCVGYWAIHFEDGEFGGIPLAGVNAVVLYDTPQHMISGNWTEAILIDEQASADQRKSIEAIFSGAAGGPWAVLARFVSKRLATRFVPIEIEDLGTTKRVTVAGLLESSIEAIRGRDKTTPVTFENMFNQIHPPSQVIARGGARYDDGEIAIRNENSHGLYSNFTWTVN